jgi:hypothetical protein
MTTVQIALSVSLLLAIGIFIIPYMLARRVTPHYYEWLQVLSCKTWKTEQEILKDMEKIKEKKLSSKSFQYILEHDLKNLVGKEMIVEQKRDTHKFYQLEYKLTALGLHKKYNRRCDDKYAS